MMKKIFIALSILLYSPLLWGQNVDRISQKTDKRLFPTKYAIILYGKEVTDTSGHNKQLAAHWENRGGGLFTWRKNIEEAGDYQIGIDYSANQTGTIAKLFTGMDTIAAVLQVTSGYYPLGKEWYQFNCERREMPGMIHLHKGENAISLKLITANKNQKTILYAIELLPVAKKMLIQKDRERSMKIHRKQTWFSNVPYGVMFHWTSQTAPEHGPLKPYTTAVNAFNVGAFAKMVMKTGARYVILTTNHAEPYFPAPLKEWEKVYPGHTTNRDLIKEIADSLQKYNVKLFLYLATHVYAKFDKVTDKEFKHLNYTFIKEIGKRYGKKVAGYWFDGWYQCYEKHPNFDFERFYKICKKGNKNRLVCFNAWLYPVTTLWQDYWAGEVYSIGNPPISRIMSKGPGRGLQAHSLIVMEKEGWLHTSLNAKIPSPSLRASDLINFISQSERKGPVTINIQIYQDGKISDEALNIMKQVKKHFETGISMSNH